MAGVDTGPITVAVVHVEELVRAGLCATLGREADFRVVFEGERLDELSIAVEEGRMPEPRVVLLLVTPPLDPACAAMKRWRKNHGQASLVVIGPLTPLIVQRVLEVGVLGTLPCGVTCAEVMQSLRTVASGSPYGNTWLMQHLQRGARSLRAHQRDDVPELTDREAEVLRLMNHPEGLTYEVIGEKLEIDRRTVESHRDKLFEKFGVHKRQALLRKAAELGLL
jgi:DNA-binding NarL/FixJ family response regulator